MLNIGIIGPGRVAERHANALKNVSNAQLWSIAGRTLNSAKAFAEKHLAGPTEQRSLTINNNAFVFSEVNAYAEQIKAFIQSIENNAPPEVTLEEGLKNVAHLVEIK